MKVEHYDNLFHATVPVEPIDHTPNDMISHDEIILLLNLCKGRGRVLEIGTWRGITTNNILNVAGHVVSIDVTEPPMTLTGGQGVGECLPKDQIGARISDENRLRCDLRQYNPNEANGLKNLLSSIGGEYDMIIIDGDHSNEGVLIDYNETLPYLSVDGIILFHDCWWDVKPEPVIGPLTLLTRLGGFVLNRTHYGIIKNHGKRINAEEENPSVEIHEQTI